MQVELRALTRRDGGEVYAMLQQIPRSENGFGNTAHGLNRVDFAGWLEGQERMGRGEGLRAGRVPQSTYWLYVDGAPVGMGKLRHRLNPSLRLHSGHVGYAVRPGCRGKGYGCLLLHLLLERAAALGLEAVLVTANEDNLPSIRTAMANGGVLEDVLDGSQLIWVPCPGSPEPARRAWFYDMDIGRVGIAERGGAVTHLFFGGTARPMSLYPERTELLDRAAGQLREYLAGNRRRFDLPLAPEGTDFQERVWNELRAVDYGKTRTYSQLAEAIGNPRACRAVGRAVGHNPTPILLPCHRVVGAGGKLTGYAGGLALKQRLLAMEGGRG